MEGKKGLLPVFKLFFVNHNSKAVSLPPFSASICPKKANPSNNHQAR